MCLQMNSRVFFSMLKEGSKQERIDSNQFLVDLFDIVALTQASKTDYLTDTRQVFVDRINRDRGIESLTPKFVEKKLEYKTKEQLDFEANKFMGMAQKYLKVQGIDGRRQ